MIKKNRKKRKTFDRKRNWKKKLKIEKKYLKNVIKE